VSLSLRQRHKLMAGGVEVLSECLSVQQDLLRFAVEALLAAMRRCRDCIGLDAPDCGVCLSVQAQLRTHLNSLTIAHATYDAYLASVVKRRGITL